MADDSHLDGVGVLGAGMMGVSLAQLTAQAGLEVVLKVRPSPGAVERGRSALAESLSREVAAGRIAAADAPAVLARVRVADDPAALGGCDLLLENLPEQLELKRAVLGEIEPALRPDCVLASNTSSLRLCDLAEVLARPGNFLGMHYFWPAYRYPLVEIAHHETTGPRALDRARALARRQGVRELLVRGTPGYLTTRLILAYFSEALYLAEQGVSFEAADNALEAFGWPRGPFRLMDFLGLENLAHIHDALLPLMGERVAGVRRLWALHAAGLHGRRGGAGFYLYGPDGARPNPLACDMLRQSGAAPADPDEVWRRPVFMLIHEAAHCLAEGVIADWQAADLGANVGLSFPARQGGLLAYLHCVGWSDFVETLRGWEVRYGARFRPSWRERVLLEPIAG